MKSFYGKTFICLTVLMLFITSCNNRVRSVIKIPELLLVYSTDYGINYENLLNKAIEGDMDAIRGFALLEFRDAVAYDHGSVMVEMISIIGEDVFISSLSSITKKQKLFVKGYIEAGLEYGNDKSLRPDFKSVFPRIYSFLCE